ncbi:MAG: hypothetical protein HYV07_16850 [Deltaproteobacteria bacterium]|nr:hypothetical protein [Deltaproteobacteria bacterium]
MSRHIALALLLVACEAQRSAPAPWSPARSANQGPKTDPRRPEAPDAGAAPKEELLFAAVVAPTPRALRATLGSCASAGCTLVVTFDQPVGEPDDLPSPESLGARVASSGPAELSWRSSTELEIIPKPGSFAHGEQVRVEVAAAGLSEELTVPYFTAAGKTAAWPVIRGKPRVIDALDDHTRLVGKRPILLLYDQPVELTRKFRATFHAVSASGASLPLSVFRPSDLGDLVDEPVALEHVVAVRVGALPSAGEPIELVYPSNTDESPTERSRFTVAESRPTVLSEDAAGPFTASPWLVPIDARIRLDFAAPVRQRTLESTLSIEPTPKSRNVLVYGSSAYVSMTLEPGMNYRFKLDRKLTDILGNSSGNASVTLRTRDLPPALELPNGPVVALERGRARLAVRALNVNVVQPEAVRLDDETFARALASGQADCQTIAGERSPLGTFRTHVLTNQRGDFEIPLDLGTNRKSQLCVLLRGQPIGSEASAPLLASALVQSSGLGMTTKLSPRGGIVFVTRLADAAPVKGANVEILDAEGKRLSIEARTDRDGIAEINPGPSSPLPSELFVVARVRDDSVIARVSDDTTSRAWQFGIPAEQPNLEAAVFTDRGVYRPGESVKVKIVARPDDSVPRAGKVRVQVRDSRDQALLDKDQATDRFGGADLDVPLAAQAPVGEYSMRSSSRTRPREASSQQS